VALVKTDVSEKRIVFIISALQTTSLQLLVIANVVPSSLIPFNLMTEAIRSSETSVLTRATRRHIAEDGVLQASWRLGY
jgi:hypothetical protein